MIPVVNRKISRWRLVAGSTIEVTNQPTNYIKRETKNLPSMTLSFVKIEISANFQRFTPLYFKSFFFLIVHEIYGELENKERWAEERLFEYQQEFKKKKHHLVMM